MRSVSRLAAVLLAAAVAAAAADPPVVYRPELRRPEMMEPFLPHVRPGSDAFPDEKEAEELAARLGELAQAWRADPAHPAAALGRLLAPAFRGGRLQSAEDAVSRNASLEIARARSLPSAATLDAGAFGGELAALLRGLREVVVAELLITAIDVDRARTLATTDVRYDIVGRGQDAWRASRTGTWRLVWRRDGGAWRIAEWTATSLLRSRAPAPVFVEVTAAALGGNESFRRQLGVPLDAWSATIDSAIARDSNGHHGVSAGDADGDGLDDLFVAQPAGLPDRLFRAKGDGTFEDVTEKAGLGVLDDTAQSLFADVDNDGDQDLVLGLSAGPALFRNDGRGVFARDPEGFRFRDRLQGSPMSMAMADYDRDGFLDLYLCVYSFFYGAGEDKAGTPMPYYDARNGPPSALFHNDGHGRFVETTREAGLDAGNDAYHFAAAWSDYDGDGWPDLFVANDFGRKNLYRNLGARGGPVRFEDVAAAAGVLDHGAGMSASWVDYDNDGRPDIYAGNMWSPAGQRVTASAAFMPEASPEVRAHYRHHALGNSLLRNRGDGTFEDVTVPARAGMGRWAWSSDALDFDSDGWEDLYVANGMLTRGPLADDLDGFFWRQVVARSPAARVTGTPYDDAWRSINQLLVHGSIAGHQRNVLLRNDGRGAFDDVSGTVGLDLDQDGRSFAVFDADQDGDPDLALMAARDAPQLRVFRNDFAARGAVTAVRLVGRTGNRDAVGARVTVSAGDLRRTREVQAGSGFLSQHSRELLFGLGPRTGPVEVTVEWPGAARQVFSGVAPNQRLLVEEGSPPRTEPLRPPPSGAASAAVERASPPSATWLYEPFPFPDLTVTGSTGEALSVSSLRGRPALLLFVSTAGEASRAARAALAEGASSLASAGVATAAAALGGPSDDVGRSVAVLYRHLFMNRQALPLPAAFLLDAEGRVVKVYRERLDVAAVRADVPQIDAEPGRRLERAVPFPGTFHSSPGSRSYLPYGHELMDQGLTGPALAAFELAAQGQPTASTLYRLGTLLVKSGEPGRAREALERALALKPDLSEARNDLGALLAQQGDLPGAIAQFRAALEASPDYPDALNNLGYALLLTGQPAQARELYEKALSLQPDFPEALNNLGLIHGRAGEMDQAEARFRAALARRPGYGEAANNLALVLVARGASGDAVRLLEEFLEKNPDFEGTYVTLAKVHLAGGRRREGLQVLERLLQRNPNHPLAREIVRQETSGGR